MSGQESDIMNSEDDPCLLLDLPDEILVKILENLDFTSVLRAGRSCTRLYRLSRDEGVWSLLLEADFSLEDRKEIQDHVDISSQEAYSALYKRKLKLPLLWWAQNMARDKTFSIYSVIPPVICQQLGENKGTLDIL